MAKKKIYVVFNGKETGIFAKPWHEVKQHVLGFPNAQFKGYTNMEEANKAWQHFVEQQKQNTGKIENNHENQKNNQQSQLSNANKLLIENYDTVIYTDGACEGNPGPCGSGLAIYLKGIDMPILFSGHYQHKGTNNIAELKALDNALEYAQNKVNKNKYHKTKNKETICILADSNYAIQCITEWAYNWKANGWQKSSKGEIKNLELIQHAHSIYDQIKNHIQVQHVKGHSGVEGNELADRMAVQSIRNKQETLVEYSYDSIEQVLALESF